MNLQAREQDEQNVKTNNWWAFLRTILAIFVASFAFLTGLSICAYTEPLPIPKAVSKPLVSIRSIDKRLAFEGFESALEALTLSCFLEAQAKDPSTSLNVKILATVSAERNEAQLRLEVSDADALFLDGCLRRLTRKRQARLTSLEGQEGQFYFKARFEEGRSIVQLTP